MAKLTKKQVVAGNTGAGIAAALALALTALTMDEGKRNTGYLDIVKVPTICYGHTGPGVKVGQRATDDQCKALLESDARQHMEGALRCTPVLAEHPNQLAAVTRLTFNIGVQGYCKSSIAKLFNQGEYRKACDRFLAYRYAKGKEIRGLLFRRQRERETCLSGL